MGGFCSLTWVTENNHTSSERWPPVEGYSNGIFFLSKLINFFHRLSPPLTYGIYKYCLISWGILIWWDIILNVSYAIFSTCFGGSLWIKKSWLESVCAALCVKNGLPTLEWGNWATLFITWHRWLLARLHPVIRSAPNCSPLENNYITTLSAFWLHAFLKSIAWNY